MSKMIKHIIKRIAYQISVVGELAILAFGVLFIVSYALPFGVEVNFIDWLVSFYVIWLLYCGQQYFFPFILGEDDDAVFH